MAASTAEGECSVRTLKGAHVVHSSIGSCASLVEELRGYTDRNFFSYSTRDGISIRTGEEMHVVQFVLLKSFFCFFFLLSIDVRAHSRTRQVHLQTDVLSQFGLTIPTVHEESVASAVLQRRVTDDIVGVMLIIQSSCEPIRKFQRRTEKLTRGTICNFATFSEHHGTGIAYSVLNGAYDNRFSVTSRTAHMQHECRSRGDLHS